MQLHPLEETTLLAQVFLVGWAVANPWTFLEKDHGRRQLVGQKRRAIISHFGVFTLLVLKRLKLR